MLELERLGTLAVLVPDREPSSPPETAPGEPLSGVPLHRIPAGHQALLSADPASLVPGSGQRLQLRLRLDDGPPLASGTRAEAVVRVRTAATTSAPAFIESWSQDVILHQREQALTATLVLNAAAEQVGAGQVHGDVTVELHRPPQGPPSP